MLKETCPELTSGLPQFRIVDITAIDTMSEFKSHRDYQKFRNKITRETRYVRDEWIGEFFNGVISTAQRRASSLHKNTFLWRSQLGHCWRPPSQDDEQDIEVPHPYPPDRMTPRENRATGGRANPIGIPHLYLATKPGTAMAEARPGVSTLISLAQFRTNRTLDLIDCASEHRAKRVYLDEPEPDKWEGIVWADINRAFSEPVSRDDDVAEYAPTQVLAELFKNEGYDGVVYRSSLADGHNLVLFDLDTATLINRSLYEVESVNFRLKKIRGMPSQREVIETDTAG